MKRWLTVALAAGLLVTSAAGGDNKKELAKFQGTWELSSGEKDGKKQMAKLFRVIKGNTYTLKDADDKVIAEGTFKLDASTSPKSIDVTRKGGKPVLGIYAFDGEMQKICLAPQGKPRPKAFSSKDDHILSVWKRPKK
jgi:uncharacterized protein (TIGR03067 family)